MIKCPYPTCLIWSRLKRRSSVAGVSPQRFSASCEDENYEYAFGWVKNSLSSLKVCSFAALVLQLCSLRLFIQIKNKSNNLALPFSHYSIWLLLLSCFLSYSCLLPFALMIKAIPFILHALSYKTFSQGFISDTSTHSCLCRSFKWSEITLWLTNNQQQQKDFAEISSFFSVLSNNKVETDRGKLRRRKWGRGERDRQMDM